MDELMKNIVEKLNLSIDKVPEIYEALKWQYVIYDTCNILISILSFIIGISIIFSVFSALFLSEDFTLSIKIFKFTISLLIVLGVVIVGILIFRNINTPDIVFLKGMIRR